MATGWKNRLPCLAGLASLLALVLATPAQAGVEKIKPTHTDNYQGTVTVSTSADGKAVLVSLPPAHPGGPLTAAFVVQWEKPVDPPIEYRGEAKLAFTQLSLMVKPLDQPGWFFKIDAYGDRIPPEVKVMDVVGIASYAWGPQDQSFPTSHEQFAEFVSAEDPCTGCISGGPGASQCSSAPEPASGKDCSVTCKEGYYACCNGVSCVCCATLAPTASLNPFVPAPAGGGSAGNRPCRQGSQRAP